MTTESRLIDGMMSTTANGALTYQKSSNACVDLFFIAGATRTMSVTDIISMFEKAYMEDPYLALMILFWARDCRGGAGEKRFFRIIARNIASEAPDVWHLLVKHVPTFGSWKDIFLMDKPSPEILAWLSTQLEENSNANLLAKWFPRKGHWFAGMHKYKDITPKEFRQYLVKKTNVVETLLCTKQFELVDYKTVPSIAMNKYRKTFIKRDGIWFNLFNEAVLAGKTKVNASTLFPHLLLQAMNKGEDPTAVEAQWMSLPNYMEGSKERIIPVCDVSSSMNGLPMEVSIALGLYIAERNEGIFKNAYFTFSKQPTMEYVEGLSLYDKFESIRHAKWGGSTNLQATFNLLLNAALKAEIPQDQMPTKILIISDMEFNNVERSFTNRRTNLDAIREKYATANYNMPEIIFWNVNGRVGNVPAQADDSKVGLVSGFSPSILTAILQGEVKSPEQFMRATVCIPKYMDVIKKLC